MSEPTESCTACGKTGVLYLTQLGGESAPLCSGCLKEVSGLVARWVRDAKYRNAMARIEKVGYPGAGGEKAVTGSLSADDIDQINRMTREFHAKYGGRP